MSRASSSSRRRRPVAPLVCLIVVAVVVAVVIALDLVLALVPSRGVTASTSPSSAPASTPVVAAASARPTNSSPTPTPVSPAAQGCTGHPTLMSVWAHPDDDIIFGNPTISDAIAAGDCVRTVFLTAGDAGKGMGYTTSRELGILQAYDAMRGSSGLWDDREILLDAGARVTRFAPQDDPRLSVLFLRLPDGNITDGGFAATGYATLSKLLDGSIPTLAPLDGGPVVSRSHLSESLVELAAAWRPTMVLTHIPRGSAFAPGDHPDHSVVGALVRDALTPLPDVGPGIRYLVGYPSEELPRNVDGARLDAKVETYRVYTQQDDVIRCADRSACLNTRRFGQWLQRSYPKAETDLQMG
ncbi:PIG-L family deacetylase [Microbacterium trichothecenolyticum]|uniref:LmbE family N-acetylglucosaminyl deacetylase n=1 Tax=Microbacterium trichothecenolyticum TaxID=69370 RepID=A0ABU0TU88_MICTR|nr:PIG-L family deacetylase [Microbacterium trichothecenolyticum]MDQ1123233.1 LmbE family N-acetylglucosaminyl deacetylase [Microbacterium trichothecenolyticum]